jgi:hypothetical protein
MHFLFPEKKKSVFSDNKENEIDSSSRPLWQVIIYFFLMISILVFANWGKPEQSQGIWSLIYEFKWFIASISAVLLGTILVIWYKYDALKILVVTALTLGLGLIFDNPMIPFLFAFAGLIWASVTGTDEGEEWMISSWDFAKQIFPLLFAGILIAGFLLGRPETEGIIPSAWISYLVGKNSLMSNFFASITGAFMYFATLTEVPILEGLIANGMEKGPALALLLAGPAVSLPNMLVIRSVIGTKKTLVFVMLVVVMATLSGLIYGKLF